MVPACFWSNGRCHAFTWICKCGNAKTVTSPSLRILAENSALSNLGAKAYHMTIGDRRFPSNHLRVPEIINAMEDKIDYSKIEFTPVVQIPDPFDIEKRIQELRSYLDPKSPDYQHSIVLYHLVVKLRTTSMAIQNKNGKVKGRAQPLNPGGSE
jgi:hypothetical protein